MREKQETQTSLSLPLSESELSTNSLDFGIITIPHKWNARYLQIQRKHTYECYI